MLRTEKVVGLVSDVKEGVVGLSVDFVFGVVMVVGVVTFVVEGVVLVVTFVVVVGIVVVVEVVVGVVVVLGVVDDVVITVEVVTSFSQNEPEKFGGHRQENVSLLVWEHDPIPHGLSAHVVGVSQFIPRNLAKKIIAINIKKKMSL